MTATWFTIFFIVLIWSGINPKDYFTWILEVMPALIALVLLALTRKRFKFTRLAYALILVHCIILMIGGHYTYAEVPFFSWLKDVFDLKRNNYDKVGHFAQGFVPAIVAREILIRNNAVKNKNWLVLFVISICLSISALYELIEWWVAELVGESSEAFLGTQGYTWDTQSDMGWALLGTVLSLVLFSHYHDRQLQNIKT
jgi:putative membrane protein